MLFDNILDEVVSNSVTRGAGGPSIVSEQHDASKINWLRGMSDPGEMLSCGYLPELRRRDHESEESHYQRILPIFLALPQDIQDKLNAAGAGAAIQRAQLATANGKIAYVGIDGADWHMLGTRVSGAMNFDQAIKLAPHVNITIDKRQNRVLKNDGTFGLAPSWSLVRSDTDEIFATVGAGYSVIQPRDAFDYSDEVLGDFGARIETLGHTFNGKSMFMTVQFPDLTFKVNGKDTVFAYGIFTNQHGGRAAHFFPSTFRAVCHNTQRLGYDKYGKLGVSIRHTGNIKQKADDARRALMLGVKSMKTFAEQAEVMARTKIEPRPFFENLLDEVADVTAAQMAAGTGTLLAKMVNKSDEEREAKVKQFERQCKLRKEMMRDLFGYHDSENNTVNGMAGTVWGVYNSANEYADHYKPGRKVGTTTEQRSRQFESKLVGERDDIKQTALQMALAAI